MATANDAPFDGINFGDVPDAVNALLQEGVRAHRSDRQKADTLFRAALALEPSALPTYLCLYKIHAYQGRLDEARAIALLGLSQAARQAGWAQDWRDWAPAESEPKGPGRFALYTLKAPAFIALRDGRRGDAAEKLAYLARLDPGGAVGWPVVASLAEALAN